MVVQIGRITGREVKTNRDGAEDVILLQVEVSDSDDIQTVELHRGAGVDLNPPDGSIVVLVNAGNAWQIAATTNDNVTPDDLDEGAYEIYSSDSGAKVAKVNLDPTGAALVAADDTIDLESDGSAKINLDPSGDVTINDGAKSAVSFPDLKTQFDLLVTNFNTLVTAYNAHVHTGVLTGLANSGAPAAPGVP